MPLDEWPRPRLHCSQHSFRQRISGTVSIFAGWGCANPTIVGGGLGWPYTYLHKKAFTSPRICAPCSLLYHQSEKTSWSGKSKSSVHKSISYLFGQQFHRRCKRIGVLRKLLWHELCAWPAHNYCLGRCSCEGWTSRAACKGTLEIASELVLAFPLSRRMWLHTCTCTSGKPIVFKMGSPVSWQYSFVL